MEEGRNGLRVEDWKKLGSSLLFPSAIFNNIKTGYIVVPLWWMVKPWSPNILRERLDGEMLPIPNCYVREGGYFNHGHC